MDIVERLVEVEGGALCVSVQSNGDGPLLFFCHATGFCKEVWQPVVDELAAIKSGWKAVLIDQRHHGKSQGFAPDYDWWNLARDLLAVVDDRKPAIGIGHSGGGAAVAMAELTARETFAGAVLVEPIVFPPPYEVLVDHPLEEAARKRRAEFASFEAVFEAYHGRGPFARWTDAALWAYVHGGFRPTADGTVALRSQPASEAQFFLHASAHGAWDRLGELSLPVKLLAGERSDTHNAEFAAAQAARFGNAELEIVAGAGHFVPMERPGKVARSIAQMMEMD